MGVVYGAYDPEFNQRVAIKAIHEQLLAAEQDKARDLTSKLQNAGISNDRVTPLAKARENAEAAYRRLGKARDDPRTPAR